MIDSHCHLADDQFDHDFKPMLARAGGVGVKKMICIADDIPEAEKCIRLAKRYDQIFCTVGIHPHHAVNWTMTTADRIRTLAKEKKVRAIGEIGLDYHYLNSPEAAQKHAFRMQLAIAEEEQLPAVVHCREAIDDVKEILSEFEQVRAVIHCCTEKWSDVADLVERGYLLSFTGIATYPKSLDVHKTIRLCPMESMMIETDSPYLSPEPHRGKRNEPAFVVEVAKKIAELKDISLQEVDDITTKNAINFFALPS